MGVVALDFSYALSEFQRTSSAILSTFVIGTLVSLGIALLLTVIPCCPIIQLSKKIYDVAAISRDLPTGSPHLEVARA